MIKISQERITGIKLKLRASVLKISVSDLDSLIPNPDPGF